MVIVLKFSDLDDREVYADSFKVGKVKDVVIDDSTWKVTHLVLELTKDASEELLGIKPAVFQSALNRMAISALEEGAICCSEDRVDLKVSKGQLKIYLSPTQEK